jgi:hypothetical protein
VLMLFDTTATFTYISKSQSLQARLVLHYEGLFVYALAVGFSTIISYGLIAKSTQYMSFGL